MNQRELTIQRIRKLPASRDKRCAPFLQKKFDKDKRVIIAYLSGELKELSNTQNDKFKVVILNDIEHTKLYIKKSNPYTPVPAGKFMDWWEPDHEKYFGVSKHQWNSLPKSNRANLEARLQLKLWVEKEYKYLYNEFYYPIQHDKWWFDN